MMCNVCFKQGMIPKCPFCGRKADPRKKKSREERMRDEALKSALKERIRLNELAHKNFKKTNSAGSGCESFDEDIKRTHGDWE